MWRTLPPFYLHTEFWEQLVYSQICQSLYFFLTACVCIYRAAGRRTGGLWERFTGRQQGAHLRQSDPDQCFRCVSVCSLQCCAFTLSRPLVIFIVWEYFAASAVRKSLEPTPLPRVTNTEREFTDVNWQRVRRELLMLQRFNSKLYLSTRENFWNTEQQSAVLIGDCVH